ncbi:helix-turn-helix domain-containing protein [Jiulongibacter sediminis]|uniref:HTH araC/xylS-type domain-containing protein n=1 Tax=Jiulongibacter sediminis TaxID=1605367 RepID=A0A0P7B8U0_9BACT|nr:AraC family transcriptional regulator [Jiulongibacter sediminis]KPM46729.1 hypothetical protein AFM12_18330 [Jiulongibacter sediminis]TBX21635.1 hypothetical protein TK44_18335 [Jiulongibacter sediminis]
MFSLKENELVGSDGRVFETTESHDCGVYTRNYKNLFFDGTIKSCQTADKISLTSFDFQIHEDVDLLFNGDEYRKMLKVLCNNGDPVNYHLSKTVSEQALVLGKEMLISNNLLAYILGLKANRTFRAVTIETDLQNLINEKYCDEPGKAEQLTKLAAKSTTETQPLTQRIQDIIMQMWSEETSGLKGRLILESQAVELLAQAYGLSFKEDTQAKPTLSPADMQAVEEAADILHKEFKTPPLQQDLSRRVGLNLNKLSSLFQQVFGLTINKYLLNIRLEKARTMLNNNPELTVVQLSEEIGFSNPSYFIRKFKEVYGKTPGAYV